MHRAHEIRQEAFSKVANWGHSAVEMVGFHNCLLEELEGQHTEADIIISGGVRDFMEGYYLTEKSHANAIYGQASAFLKYARGDYETLQEYAHLQIEGLKLAKTYLRLKS
jgi:isopentenyl-diphosphate delta-isomerase